MRRVGAGALLLAGLAAAVAAEAPRIDSIERDRDGNLFFLDAENRRIRAVRFGAVLAPPADDVQATLGSAQSAPAARAFATPLEVAVKTASGSLAHGVRVDFEAPAGAAFCTFSNCKMSISVVTDRPGKAQATCTASSQPGSYRVSATPLGSAKTGSFSLRNTPSTAPRRASLISTPRCPT